MLFEDGGIPRHVDGAEGAFRALGEHARQVILYRLSVLRLSQFRQHHTCKLGHPRPEVGSHHVDDHRLRLGCEPGDIGALRGRRGHLLLQLIDQPVKRLLHCRAQACAALRRQIERIDLGVENGQNPLYPLVRIEQAVADMPEFRLFGAQQAARAKPVHGAPGEESGWGEQQQGGCKAKIESPPRTGWRHRNRHDYNR